MKKFFKEHGVFVWMGAAFAFITGYSIDSWQWWAFVFPSIVFVVLRDDR